MLLVPKTVRAKLSCYRTYKAEKQKKKATSPLFVAPRQTGHPTSSLYTILLLPSTVTEETKGDLF